MQISFTPEGPKVQAGSWVVAASEGGHLTQAAIRADKAAGGALVRAMKFSRFTGKSGQMLEVPAPEGLSASRILLVGLGKPDGLDAKGLEVIGAQIVARLESVGETFGHARNRGAQGRQGQAGRRRRRIWRSARGCAVTVSTNTAPAIWMSTRNFWPA